MIVEKSWVTCKEAAVILNYTQRHIINLIKKGKISAERDENGKHVIQKAELFRVYPDAFPKEIEETEKNIFGYENKRLLEEKIKHLQELLEEKRRQNDFLTQQLNNFTEEKLKLIETINGHIRLLEYKESSEKIIRDKTQPIPKWKSLFKKD